jgi:hypothetical protein
VCVDVCVFVCVLERDGKRGAKRESGRNEGVRAHSGGGVESARTRNWHTCTRTVEHSCACAFLCVRVCVLVCIYLLCACLHIFISISRFSHAHKSHRCSTQYDRWVAYTQSMHPTATMFLVNNNEKYTQSNRIT